MVVATTLLLAASLLMENTSADLLLAAHPTPTQLAEKVQLLKLAEAPRTALKQDLE